MPVIGRPMRLLTNWKASPFPLLFRRVIWNLDLREKSSQQGRHQSHKTQPKPGLEKFCLTSPLSPFRLHGVPISSRIGNPIKIIFSIYNYTILKSISISHFKIEKIEEFSYDYWILDIRLYPSIFGTSFFEFRCLLDYFYVGGYISN